MLPHRLFPRLRAFALTNHGLKAGTDQAWGVVVHPAAGGWSGTTNNRAGSGGRWPHEIDGLSPEELAEVRKKFGMVFQGGALKAVIVGYKPYDFWKNLPSKLPSKGILIYDPGFNVSINDNEMIWALESRFRMAAGEKITESLHEQKEEIGNQSDIFAVILPAAVADSINPCTFNVFTAMLLITAFAGRNMLTTGVSFIVAVFTAYMLLGVGLIHLIPSIPYVNKIVGVAGLLFSTTRLYHLMKKRKFKSPIPKKAKIWLEEVLTRVPSPPMAFAIGFLASVTLLPCSSMPYMIALTYISSISISSKTYAAALLILYNLIFILPLILILAATHFAIIKFRTVKRLRGKLEYFEAVSLAIIASLSTVSYTHLTLPTN